MDYYLLLKMVLEYDDGQIGIEYVVMEFGEHEGIRISKAFRDNMQGSLN